MNYADRINDTELSKFAGGIGIVDTEEVSATSASPGKIIHTNTNGLPLPQPVFLLKPISFSP